MREGEKEDLGCMGGFGFLAKLVRACVGCWFGVVGLAGMGEGGEDGGGDWMGG